LAEGADADVFASVDTANMTVVADAGVVSGPPVPFAATKLVIVAPPGNPGRITSFADLGRPGLRVAVCAADGACGSATELAEQRASLRLPSVISETTSGGVLKDVTTGKADAGVVFMTDARASGDSVSWIPLHGGIGDVTSWISLIKDTGEDAQAAEFVREVTGVSGRRILEHYGFTEPLNSPAG
jgi:molybdate transport system substrate-binding protein